MNEKVESAYALIQEKLAFYCAEEISVPTIRCLQSILQQSYQKLTGISFEEVHSVSPSLEDKSVKFESSTKQPSVTRKMFQGMMKTGEEIKRENQPSIQSSLSKVILKS